MKSKVREEDKFAQLAEVVYYLHCVSALTITIHPDHCCALIVRSVVQIELKRSRVLTLMTMF